MKKLLTVLVLLTCAAALPAAARARVFVLTDIEKEPDDAMSLVRSLTHANQFQTQGLVATTSMSSVARTQTTPPGRR